MSRNASGNTISRNTAGGSGAGNRAALRKLVALGNNRPQPVRRTRTGPTQITVGGVNPRGAIPQGG